MTEEQLYEASGWLKKANLISVEIKQTEDLLTCPFYYQNIRLSIGRSEFDINEEEAKQFLGIHLDGLKDKLKYYKDKIEKL